MQNYVEVFKFNCNQNITLWSTEISIWGSCGYLPLRRSQLNILIFEWICIWNLWSQKRSGLATALGQTRTWRCHGAYTHDLTPPDMDAFFASCAGRQAVEFRGFPLRMTNFCNWQNDLIMGHYACHLLTRAAKESFRRWQEQKHDASTSPPSNYNR